MYRISKEFHFSASHQLDHLPDGHQCARLHGHNYVIVVILESETLDHNSFVRDYGELDIVKIFIEAEWDHTHLNDYFDNHFDDGPRHTTAENIAYALYEWLFHSIPELAAVQVKETPKTCSEYRPTLVFESEAP